MNLRGKDRVDVNLVCTFTKSGKSFAGHVKNMSRFGLMTVWNDCNSSLAQIQEGETWQIEIELPVYHSFTPNAFYCQAVVVRVAADRRNHPEVAFRIDRMTAADLRSKTTAVATPKQMVM